ncbi:unnamed protein product, partial [Closterium sp. Yama58-4]
SDVIRAASGQVMFPMPAPLAPVATRITVTSPPSTFASNFSAARCTNLPRTAYSVSVQWTSAAAPNLPACANITFWSGAGCTGTSSLSLKPASLTTSTTNSSLLYPYPVSARCFIAGDPVDRSAGWPTEVEARVAVTTAVKVGRYNFSFDPSSRCSRLPDATAPAGVSTVASVQWGSASSLPGGGASGPCSRVSFFPGTTCNGAVMQHIYSFSSNTATITPSQALASVVCGFPTATVCKYTTCPANSVCWETSDFDSRAATCRCKDGYAVINGTCQDKCNLYCVANASCVRDASKVPDCVCNKGFQYAPNSNTCVDKCSFVNCGPNSKCIKDANGNATCACNAGFQMPPDRSTCVDKCEFVTCKANSTCVKDANGNTTCECIKGFERLPGNDACVDKCESVDCGTGGKCRTDADGNPECTCITGFTLSDGSCNDNCDWFGAVCYPGSCKKDTNGNPYCECGKGFKQSADKLRCDDICQTKDCGPNGWCVASYDNAEDMGHPTCQCNEGFVDLGTCIDICKVTCANSKTCWREGDRITYCTQWEYCDLDCGEGWCEIDRVHDTAYCRCHPDYKWSDEQQKCI